MKYGNYIVTLLLAITGVSQEIVSKELSLANGAVKFLGTPTYPKTEKKPLLAIFVHGSGNANRNGNQASVAKAQYIRPLADNLNRHNIAHYSYDKHTSVRDNLTHLAHMVFEDLVEDVQPVLIVQGRVDLQVTVDDANKLPATAITAHLGSTPQLKVVPTMDHVLKIAADAVKNQASYYGPSFPISPKLAAALVAIVKNNG